MIFRSEILEFTSLLWFKLAAGFLIAFIVTMIGIPSVVKLSRYKGLYDMPGDRTSHEVPTPRLGGTMIFAGIIISTLLLSVFGSVYVINCIVTGIVVLFFIGLKDDIVDLVPLKKAAGQLIAALIIVVLGDVRLDVFGTQSGHSVIAFSLDVCLSLLVVMTLINSINLIDGIDGLASGIGIIGSVFFGIWNILNDNAPYALLSFSLAGSLLAFTWFNVFSSKYKIFLGDTGSMIIGFLLAVFLIHFIRTNAALPVSEKLASAPAIAFSVLVVPVFDTLRICVVRLSHGRSILRGDNNHIHHSVLKVSGTHLKATVIMLTVNILLILFTYLARNLGNLILIIIMLAIASAISIALHYFLIRKS